ncbi:hypothetical protein ACFJIX_18780 [Roseateles sp. UC29_93]|uniref:hypothetical protein n=1 Tax=Roseateles sp. UC29_93 TaxID=3350177 RepID=UPI00366C8A3C
MNTAKRQTLFSRAVVDASNAFNARCSELRGMRQSLDLLDVDLPELEKRRIAPQPGQITWLPNKGSLALHMACKDDANLLYRELLVLGYAECVRQDFVGGLSFVDLQKGSLRLNVAVHTDKDAA